MAETPVWTPEPYDISHKPSFSLLNISKQNDNADFARSAKWCSDGSVIIAQTESGCFQRFDIGGTPQNVLPTRQFPQPAPVLDFIWYPTASLLDPASFCFVASVRECPVKLLDAFDGRLRASYRIVDHRERQIAPHSLTFNLTGQKLYCGFEDAIEVFDLSRPGESTRLRTTPSKKSKDGLKGIISALAFSPSYSPGESFYAAGSFVPTSSNIAMFSDVQTEPLMYLGGGPQAGVTQLRFNPMKPHILYASYRGHASGTIYSWDVRSNVDVPLEIFRTDSSSKARTNQKMWFDVDVAGRLLSIGDQEGNISIFELDSQPEPTEPQDPVLDNVPSNDFEIKNTLPTLKYKAHNDAVGSVSFHPYRPILVSTSGSRHFADPPESDDDDDESDEETPGSEGKRRAERSSQPVTLDCSMKIWDLK